MIAERGIVHASAASRWKSKEDSDDGHGKREPKKGIQRRTTAIPVARGFSLPPNSSAIPRPTIDAATDETAISSTVEGKYRKKSTIGLGVKPDGSEPRCERSLDRIANETSAMAAAVEANLKNATRPLALFGAAGLSSRRASLVKISASAGL